MGIFIFLEQYLRYILSQIFGELFCNILIEYHVYDNFFSQRWQRCKQNLYSTPSGERMIPASCADNNLASALYFYNYILYI